MAQTQQQVKLVQQTQEQLTTQMQQLHQQTSLELTNHALAWETTLDASNELPPNLQRSSCSMGHAAVSWAILYILYGPRNSSSSRSSS